MSEPHKADEERIFERLKEYYHDLQAVLWMYLDHPQLGEPAIDCIRRGDAHLVDAVLDRLDSDAYI